ncbi:MAG: carboxypeptidase regulatory-like domain-containing protein [Gemmatimonadaceae bacterium]|nr:carboxypeptidase regulatory-like domain-containing protein [Chitinophagaceae bacterium]
MKNKPLLLLIACLLCSVFALAKNPPGTCSKNDPDMSGNVIHAESGKPIKDVSITAYNISKKEKVVISDNNGNFSLTDLKPGTYKFVFEKDGFKKVIREKVVLKSSEAYMLNVTMAEDDMMFDLMPSPLRLTGVQ